MKALGLALAGLLLAPNASAEAPPPPPPEFVDAYIGFERNLRQPPGFPDEVWYYQYALQMRGNRLTWHRHDAICKNGRMYSSEGDGINLHYQGRVEQSPAGRTARLDYRSCEKCLDSEAHTEPPVVLPFMVLSPLTLRLGEVVYRKDVVPYPERCPDAMDTAAAAATQR